MTAVDRGLTASAGRIERVLKINQLPTVTKEVVETRPGIPRHRHLVSAKQR